jgi:hypothetical protein
MQSSTNLANEKISRVLITFAWIIEAFAVLAGLAISVMVGIDTYDKNLEITGEGRGVTNYTNVMIAALPFLMVSVVELAKIPVAQAVYATRQIFWRSLFFLMLLFLAAITFETALNGFERNYNNLNYQVSVVREKLEAVGTRTDVLNSKVTKAKSLTRELVISEFDRQNQIFTANREAEMVGLQTVRSLANTSSVAAALEAEIARLNEKRNQVSDERTERIDKLERDRKEEIDASKYAMQVGQEQLESDATFKREAIEGELKRAEREADRARKVLDRAINTRTKEIEDASFFLRTGVKKAQDSLVKEARENLTKSQLVVEKTQSRLREFSTGSVVEDNLSKSNTAVTTISKRYDSERDKINREYSQKIETLDSLVSQKNDTLLKKIGINKDDIKRERARLDGEIKKIQTNYDVNLNKIISARDEQFDIVDLREETIADHELKLSDLADQTAEYRSMINVKAADNQIYRIAMMFSPDAATPADVPRGVVDMVAKVWFSSLAMVIAITGILLALASQVVKDPKQTSVRGNSSLAATFRRLLIDMRKRQRRPKIVETIIEREVEKIVEITKEIPVDKVVLKEVVVEVVKKEIVHVPVYSDDPDLIKKSSD